MLSKNEIQNIVVQQSFKCLKKMTFLATCNSVLFRAIPYNFSIKKFTRDTVKMC